MVYKYFSELSEEEQAKYECRPSIEEDSSLVQDRGNVLGVSTPNLNAWVRQILETGEVKPHHEQVEK